MSIGVNKKQVGEGSTAIQTEPLLDPTHTAGQVQLPPLYGPPYKGLLGDQMSAVPYGGGRNLFWTPMVQRGINEGGILMLDCFLKQVLFPPENI